MNIQDKLLEIEDRFAGAYIKPELLDIWMYLHQLEGPYANCSHPLDKIEITNGADEPSVCGQCGAKLIYKKQDNGMYKWQVEGLHKQYKSKPILQVKLLSPYAKVPTRGSDGAIGWDLYALVTKETPTHIKYTQFFEAHERITIPTGIAVAIPPGYYGRIAPRSGLAVKQGVDVLAGVVDSDYRGEVKVALLNTSNESIIVDLSKPIAQLILERADAGVLTVVDELDQTGRGSGGFGSTDKETK